MTMTGLAIALLGYAMSIGAGNSINSHQLSQTFQMPVRGIYLTVDEVKGKGRYRQAWLTWSATGQQRSQYREVDCKTKKYRLLSEGGVATGQTISSIWQVDDSGSVRYICSK